MISLNKLEKEHEVKRKDFEAFLLLLAPFAPFITEEIWQRLGNDYSIHKEQWPEYKEKSLVSDTTNLLVQVNGKYRATIETDRGISESNAKKLAIANETVARHLKGEPKKIIFVKDKLINFVV